MNPSTMPCFCTGALLRNRRERSGRATLGTAPEIDLMHSV